MVICSLCDILSSQAFSVNHVHARPQLKSFKTFVNGGAPNSDGDRKPLETMQTQANNYKYLIGYITRKDHLKRIFYSAP